MATTTAKKHKYSVHPSVKMVQNWVASLKEKTGKSLDEWMRHIKKEGPADEVKRREWLKAKHGLGTNAAWWLTERSVGKGGEEDSDEAYLATAEKYVEAQYEGKKGELRPIFYQLMKSAFKIAKDVKACPCKTMVPLYRTHVFAEIKPTTHTRIDLGLALGNTKAPKRLVDTGGFAKKDRITHRIPITSVAEIDGEVLKWLQFAYERDA